MCYDVKGVCVRACVRAVGVTRGGCGARRNLQKQNITSTNSTMFLTCRTFDDAFTAHHNTLAMYSVTIPNITHVIAWYAVHASLRHCASVNLSAKLGSQRHVSAAVTSPDIL